MYCSSCGTPVTAGLSFCNRCGTGLRERNESKSTLTITAFLIAITLIGLGGLGIMLGGSVVLRESGLPVELVGFFMLFTFLIVGMAEIMLVRNLSKLTSPSERTKYLPSIQQPPLELRSPTAANFDEPLGSVTDNTTRTLEYARRER